MFCPECEAEYREGFTVCSDCRVDLVASLPPKEPVEHPDFALETVFESENPALIGVAKTVLESAGIDFVAVGEEASSVVFPGIPFMGRVRICVPEHLAEDAAELLSEIEEADELSS